MGDRALIAFHDGKEVSPVIYMHSGGSDIAKLLKECEALMESRGADVSYTAARFTGLCHNYHSGSNLSLGIWNAPGRGIKASLAAMRKPDYSHGDAGVFLVDVSASPWSIECHGGYGLNP